MKLSIALLVAVATMVHAAPAPGPAEIFARQSGCAAVNGKNLLLFTSN